MERALVPIYDRRLRRLPTPRDLEGVLGIVDAGRGRGNDGGDGVAGGGNRPGVEVGGGSVGMGESWGNVGRRCGGETAGGGTETVAGLTLDLGLRRLGAG